MASQNIDLLAIVFQTEWSTAAFLFNKMDPQDLRSLQILEELVTEESLSQRDLAKRLNISLGLANSFIKRLVKKGYIKITTVPRNRVKYMLTPQGFAEKSRLTYRFIRYSLKFYKQALGNLQTVLHDLEEENVSKVVFYGAGDLAEIGFLSLKATSITLAGVIDDFRAGETFFGHTIRSPDELKNLDYDRIILTVIESKEPIVHKLLERKILNEKIIILE